jgi:hypothetical protein
VLLADGSEILPLTLLESFLVLEPATTAQYMLTLINVLYCNQSHKIPKLSCWFDLEGVSKLCESNDWEAAIYFLELPRGDLLVAVPLKELSGGASILKPMSRRSFGDLVNFGERVSSFLGDEDK